MTFDWQAAWYPTLPARIYAAAIDESILIVGVVAAFLLIGPLNPPPVVLILLVCGFAGLEPMLVARTGASIGHHLFHLQVIDSQRGGYIGLHRAAVRMVARLLLGLPSLFFIHTTARYQAIHDMLARSVVIVHGANGLRPAQSRRAQLPIGDGYTYPSRWRRTFVVALFSLVLYILLSVVAAVIVGEECAIGERCTPNEETYLRLLGLAWTILFGVVLINGWRGRLWGCRRRRDTPSGGDTPGPA